MEEIAINSLAVFGGMCGTYFLQQKVSSLFTKKEKNQQEKITLLLSDHFATKAQLNDLQRELNHLKRDIGSSNSSSIISQHEKKKKKNTHRNNLLTEIIQHKAAKKNKKRQHQEEENRDPQLDKHSTKKKRQRVTAIDDKKIPKRKKAPNFASELVNAVASRNAAKKLPSKKLDATPRTQTVLRGKNNQREGKSAFAKALEKKFRNVKTTPIKHDEEDEVLSLSDWS